MSFTILRLIGDDIRDLTAPPYIGYHVHPRRKRRQLGLEAMFELLLSSVLLLVIRKSTPDAGSESVNNRVHRIVFLLTQMIAQVADSTLATVATGRIAAAPDEHKAIGVSLAQAAVLLIDWTDPMKVVEREGMETDGSIHIDLAVEFVKLLSQNMNRDFRKTLAAQMSKLYMPDEVDELKIKSLMVLLRNVQSVSLTLCNFLSLEKG